ncbi:MAG TPA: hypothetical protein VES38_06605 [Methylotenera sp.]|nr:hypothetical protein [Methylotenera sp.]
MKKRTKKYQPNKHPVSINSAFNVINLAKPVSEHSQVELNKAIHGALTAITRGVGEPVHFDVLASTVDVVFMMSMNLFDNAYQDDIQLAREAMFRLKDRYHDTGKFGFDGEGYNAIKELIAIHDEVVKNVTGAEMLQFMKARQNAIAGGNFYKGTDQRLAA